MVPASVTAFSRRNLAERHWGPAIALFTTIFAVGQIIGPVGGGRAFRQDRQHRAPGSPLAAAILLAGALVGWRSGRCRRRDAGRGQTARRRGRCPCIATFARLDTAPSRARPERKRNGPRHRRRLRRQDPEPVRPRAARRAPRPVDLVRHARSPSIATTTRTPSSRCARSPTARSSPEHLYEEAVESHQRHIEVDEPEEDNMALLMARRRRSRAAARDRRPRRGKAAARADGGAGQVTRQPVTGADRGRRARLIRQFELVERVRDYNPHTDEALLNRAYVFGATMHAEPGARRWRPLFRPPARGRRDPDRPAARRRLDRHRPAARHARGHRRDLRRDRAPVRHTRSPSWSTASPS